VKVCAFPLSYRGLDLRMQATILHRKLRKVKGAKVEK
jgi:hypothetical protein